MNFPHRTIRIKSHDLSEPAFGSDHPPYPIVTNTTSDCRQQNIKRWTVFHPFHANIPQQQSDSTIPNQLSHAREIFLDHLTPYGSPIMGIDPIKILRVFVLKGYVDAASLGIALLKNPSTLQLLSQDYATNISALAYPVLS